MLNDFQKDLAAAKAAENTVRRVFSSLTNEYRFEDVSNQREFYYKGDIKAISLSTGTEIYIEGYGWRIAEDCGGIVSGAHIDIAVESHDQAIIMGTTTGGVWVLVHKGY